jgi:Ca2+-binding EF-hand superfamily protein
MSARSFRRASCHVLDKTEVADFTHKVFNLFDGDGDAFLNFEEFTLAVEVKDTTGNPLGKLAWLFDTVYDKVSKTFLTSTRSVKCTLKRLLQNTN